MVVSVPGDPYAERSYPKKPNSLWLFQIGPEKLPPYWLRVLLAFGSPFRFDQKSVAFSSLLRKYSNAVP